MSNKLLDIDVVPTIQDKRDQQLLRIPDSHHGNWIVTSPAKHAENATAVNNFREGRFKPLVKLLKYLEWKLATPKSSCHLTTKHTRAYT